MINDPLSRYSSISTIQSTHMNTILFMYAVLLPKFFLLFFVVSLLLLPSNSINISCVVYNGNI